MKQNRCCKVKYTTSPSVIFSRCLRTQDMGQSIAFLDKEKSIQSPTHHNLRVRKAVEGKLVTCGGSFLSKVVPPPMAMFIMTTIQAYVSQAAAANFNQGNTSARPQMVANQIRPPAYQATLTSSRSQTQGVSKTDFDSYVKANDAVMRNVQNQGQNLQAQLNNLATSNQRLESSKNPPPDWCCISRTSLHLLSKVHDSMILRIQRNTMLLTHNGRSNTSTLVVPVEKQNPISEPDVAPVSASMPNPKPSIPYPSSFMDALTLMPKFASTLMPKFASTLKALIGNKEKLSEMARTPLNEHCSAVILNKLPEKLGDPGRFLKVQVNLIGSLQPIKDDSQDV
ncbi:hypothetical protein Tco_0762675 [Tanacetum coccineum]